MTTKPRSLIYTGLPVGAALLLLLAFFFVLPRGVAAAPETPNAISVIGFEDFDGGAINLLGTTNVFDYGAGGGSLGDVFGRVSASFGGGTGMPFDVGDDTVADVSGGGINAGDTLGLAGQNTTAFFAMNDMDAVGVNNAVWNFDISSANSIANIEIDIGAIGDFELSSSDGFMVEARVDSDAYQTIFLASTDEAAFKTYRPLDGGYTFADDDPLQLFIDGSMTAVGYLDKSDPTTGYFDSYTSTLLTGQSGNTLDIRISWSGSPSGSEPMGIDNITINGDVVSSSGSWIVNEVHADPDSTNGDANGDGIAHFSEDEFVEIYNDTGADVDISGWTLSDGAATRHTFTSDTIVSDRCTLVVFGGGTPTGDFGNCVVQVASTGALGLNNSGDTITLNNGVTDVISITYGSEAGNDQSITRDPDITGSEPLVQHSTATGSGSALFSPGTMIDGTAFSGCPAPPDSDLTIEKTGDTVVKAGENLVYEITVSNHNIDPATNVVVTDTLPISTTYVSDDSGFTPSNPSAGVYVWDLGAVLSGTQVTFNLTTTVDISVTSGTVLTNTASVSTDAAGDQPDNNEVEHYTTAYNRTPIYDIQYVPDPGMSDVSPYAEQKVLIQGVVYAVYGSGYFIADAAGPWNGVYVYNFTKPNVGDEVQVVGTVVEYYGLTEISLVESQVILSSGNAVYGPSVVMADEIVYDDVATSEAYEGVFVEIHDIVATSENNSYNEWTFTDTSAETGKVDDWGYDANPDAGDEFALLRGALVYSFSEYKVLPRDEDDVIPPAALVIDKDAVTNVAPSGLLTYTITVENLTGETLNDLTIIDMVPTTTTLSTVLDGGVSVGGTAVQWDMASLANRSSVDVRFVVQALNYPGQTIVNETYYAEATNWITQTFGAPVWTFIGNYIPIPSIQGDGFRSPMEGNLVTTQGQVVGFFEGNSSGYGDFDGFFIQDPMGDGNSTTSDAIFVNHKSLSIFVNLGDLVEVTGMVDEFNEYDGVGCSGIECLTQLTVSEVGDVQVLPPFLTTMSPLAISTVELNPPGDPTASDVYFESLESMLVTLPNTSTVVGPTSYGAVHAVRGDLGIDRVIRTGPYEGMPVAVRHWEKYGDINGSDAPNLITGSTIANADGPLGFSYGDYMIVTQAGAEWAVDTSMPPPATEPSWPAAGGTEFSFATFNTYNFDSGDTANKKTKVVNSIAQLNGAAFVALQEIEGDNSEFMTGVLDDLTTAGYNYDYAYSHPDVGGHGVALLWNTDIVTNTSWSADYQDCSEYGSSSSNYDPLWDTCRALDQYPLFSRRPVVLTGTVPLASGDLEVVVIANHFKSKLGGTPADMRRLEQGAFVNELAADFVANGSPNVIVMGDLNDFEDSAPLQALTANDILVNAWDTYAGDDTYSYIYRGVSQILDHVLVSEALNDWLVGMGVLHVNADFPFLPYSDQAENIWRTSDHDLVAATLRLPYQIVFPLIYNNYGD